MDRSRKSVSVIAVVLVAVFAFAFEAQAQRPNSKEVKDIVRVLSTKIDDFQNRLSYQLESSSADRQTANEVMTDLQDLKDRVRIFDLAVSVRRDNRDGVNEILNAAKNVDSFMSANRQYNGLENDWKGVRSQVDRLSANYGLTANWNGGNYGSSTINVSQAVTGGQSSALTGIYRIDLSQSESIADVLSGSNIGSAQRRELEEKLEAPEEITLSVNGDQVTLASSKASPVTFVADGSEKTERANGRTVRVRSTLRGNKLTVASLGGETDYTITFEPQDGGRTLKVTRRITTDYLSETIFAESIYTRTNSAPSGGTRGNSDDSGGYSSNDPNDTGYQRPQAPTNAGNQNPSFGKPRVGEYIVANGVLLEAVLEIDIDTKLARGSERFRMIVRSPGEYRGAVLEGYLSGIDRANRVWGRSNVTFNFDRITLSDGKEYDFSGVLTRVVDQSGKIIATDNEGSAQGKNKSRDTKTRGAIGAGIGALIGAITGGGSGAALGAIIGGGAGVGSVAIESNGDLRLGKGSTITVQSSSPIR